MREKKVAPLVVSEVSAREINTARDEWDHQSARPGSWPREKHTRVSRNTRVFTPPFFFLPLQARMAQLAAERADNARSHLPPHPTPLLP